MSTAPRRALVTGGSGGIGTAICRRLAQDGYQVIVHGSRDPSGPGQVVDAIKAAGGEASIVLFDVTDADETRARIEQLLVAGPIQVVVNNAGIHDDAVFPGMREDQWRRVIDVSLHGFFHVTQPLMLPMIRTRWGRVISISSVAGILGNHGQTNYAAAKGAVHMASRSLALEVATRGITVNCVAPGIVTTPMSSGTFSAEDIARMVPMRRAGTPEEVADLVAFLASTRSAYITGQVLSIDGGMA